MRRGDLKIKAMDALKKELSPLGAMLTDECFFCEDDNATLFGRKFKILIYDHIMESDVKKLSQNLFYKSNLILTVHVSQNEASLLQKAEINYCDTAGNMQLCIDNLKLSNAYVGQQKEFSVSLNLNTTTALKVVFCLLQYKEAIRWPMRRLAEMAKVSLGSVQRIMEALKKHGMIFVTPNGRFFKEKRRMLDLWVDGFNSILLPKITLGYAVFRTPHTRESWGNIKLADGMVWGGEPAVELLNGYLKAEEFSIFTSKDFRTSVKDLHLIPVGSSGYVRILKRFWSDEPDKKISDNCATAPALVVYAQLMGSSDSRCRDAALRLLKSLNDEDLSK